MKKIFILILSALLCLSTFGCNKSEKDTFNKYEWNEVYTFKIYSPNLTCQEYNRKVENRVQYINEYMLDNLTNLTYEHRYFVKYTEHTILIKEQKTLIASLGYPNDWNITDKYSLTDCIYNSHENCKSHYYEITNTEIELSREPAGQRIYYCDYL